MLMEIVFMVHNCCVVKLKSGIRCEGRREGRREGGRKGREKGRE
jgi:hypothetical protein